MWGRWLNRLDRCLAWIACPRLVLLDRWCCLYAIILLPSTKKNICERAINQNRQRKTHEEGSDVQWRALIKWMGGSADIVKRNEALHESVWPKQDFTDQLGSSLGSKIGKSSG